MFGKCIKHLVILSVMVVVGHALARADSASTLDTRSGPELDPKSDYSAISKVKPVSPGVTKVRPYSDWTSGLEGLSRYSPATWGPDCWLPVPAKGQFVIGPRVWFARIQGEARRGTDLAGLQTSIVDFEDHLGLGGKATPYWSVEAFYQFRPRWGLRYTFAPLSLEATHTPITSFNFMGQSFASGTSVKSKWDRFEHRAGIVFNISRTTTSLTKFYAEWLYLQDKLQVGSGLGAVASATWDDSKHMMITGLEFDRCIKNYKGNTLSLSARGGVAFLGDNVGYEAEASLGYLIPIKTGRFGFIKSGYRYFQVKKDRTERMFGITMDGAFVEFGFLF